MEIRKEIKIKRLEGAGEPRRIKRQMVVKNVSGDLSAESCECEVSCECDGCTCQTAEIRDDSGQMLACLCGCNEAEITEEDENGHTVIKIRVPRRTRAEGDPDALVKAAGVSEAVEGLSAEVAALARRAREQGASWSQIGAALGISKQAAWERFSGED